MLAFGALAFMRMATSEMFFVTSVPDRHRSTVLGIYFFAGMEGNGVITPFLGAAIDAWGFKAAFAGTGVILTAVLVVSAVLFVLVRRNGRGQTRTA
jgi:hypothetical protein